MDKRKTRNHITDGAMLDATYGHHPRQKNEQNVLRLNHEQTKTEDNDMLLKYIEKLNQNERVPNDHGGSPAEGYKGYRTLRQNNDDGRFMVNQFGMREYDFF